MHIRRRNPCFVEIADVLMPDFAALLRGNAGLAASVDITLLCPLSGNRLPLNGRHLGFLAQLSAHEWQPLSRAAAGGLLSEDEIIDLAKLGAVICDSAEAWATELRNEESRLAQIGWHPAAALYHASTQWRSVLGDEGDRDHDGTAQRKRLDDLVSTHGPPPPHFHRRADAQARYKLPTNDLADAFGQVLRDRRTTRHFDLGAELELADFTRVLHGTFGAIGTEQLAPEAVALKRTSASAGALHPIEAYPLVMRVAGLAPGLYHYESSSHSLALIKPLSEAEARTVTAALTIGQTYFADAHALVFHVARLDRHYWKYRRHPKAYKAVLLDSGHLSQTFYLLAAERRLGAFFTAAINDADVATLLKLDPLSEIAIGANGIGVPDVQKNQLHLRPERYDPDPAPVAP